MVFGYSLSCRYILCTGMSGYQGPVWDYYLGGLCGLVMWQKALQEMIEMTARVGYLTHAFEAYDSVRRLHKVSLTSSCPTLYAKATLQ